MKRLILTALIAGSMLIPGTADASVRHCAYTTNQAYRWIATHGDYLPRFACAIGEEDSSLVIRALREYAKTH